MKSERKYKRLALGLLLAAPLILIVAGGIVFALSMGGPDPAPPGDTVAPAPASQVGASSTVNFQGILRDAAGDPINGLVIATFRLYDMAVGGVPLWEEAQSVIAENGLFSVLLGSITLLGPATFAGGERWLGIQASADPEMAPRQPITSVPYAFVASTADQATNADSLDGLDSVDFAQAEHVHPESLVDFRDPLTPFTSATIHTGSVRDETFLAIGLDGNPIISYTFLSGLHVAHCEDPRCSSATFGALDFPIVGITGRYSSIAIGQDGLSVISYSDNKGWIGGESLAVAHCQDIACTSATLATVDTGDGDNVGKFTSIAIARSGLRSGKPIVSYYDATNLDLKVAQCHDAICSSATISTVVGGLGNDGQYSSMTIGEDGNPVISYYNTNGADLKVAHCGIPDCSGDVTITTVDQAGSAGQYSSIAIGSDGLPVISYYDATNGDLKLVHCGVVTCGSGNTITLVDAGGNVGRYSSIAIGADGFPVISYFDSTHGALKVADCENLNCSSSVRTTVDGVGLPGLDVSIAIGPDGLPVMSHRVSTTSIFTHDLKVLHCARAGCRVP